MRRFVVGITGASGVVLGIRLVEELLKSSTVHLIISEEAISIIKQETGLDWSTPCQDTVRAHYSTDRLFLHPASDFYSPVASGSFKTDGMFVVPCSMKTLSAIANGYGVTLIERAADVTIKEGRRLVLCPRETPFSAIHLDNMTKLAKLGVIIAPPVASFYHRPQGIDDLIAFWCGKMLDAMGVENELFRRWQ